MEWIKQKQKYELNKRIQNDCIKKINANRINCARKNDLRITTIERVEQMNGPRKIWENIIKYN